MIRLIRIEWLKLSHSKSFKWMMGLWLVAFITIPFALDYGLDQFASSTGEIYAQFNIDPSVAPIFSFTDLWHNFAYTYKIMTILLSVIVIVNVGMEWEEKTMRQNVIDGLSRTEYFISKEILVLILTLLSTAGLIIMGLTVGYSYSPNTSWAAITGHMDFVWGYALHVFLQLNIAMIFINVIKRTGVTILLFLVYVYFLVPIGWGLSAWQMPQGWKNITDFFPMSASWNTLPSPFWKYIFQYTPDHVAVQSILVASVWIVLTVLINHSLTTRRDLR